MCNVKAAESKESAGAPATEAEISEEMIRGVMEFFVDNALNTLEYNFVTREFAKELILVVLARAVVTTI
jgi:hypothetical protein